MIKKLLGIIALSLLLSGNAYAELITLTKCYITDLQETNGNEIYSYKNWKEQTADRRIEYENKLYTLDTVTEVITETIVFKDSYIKNMKKRNTIVKKFDKNITAGAKKVLSAIKSVNSKSSFGGTAPENTKKMIKFAIKKYL